MMVIKYIWVVLRKAFFLLVWHSILVIFNKKLAPNCCARPTMQGPIWKHSAAFHRKWQRRWFCLQNQVLYWFKKPDVTFVCQVVLLTLQKPFPSGCLFLVGVILSETSKPKNSFAIITKGKTYCLYTKTEKEKVDWMNAIEQGYLGILSL